MLAKTETPQTYINIENVLAFNILTDHLYKFLKDAINAGYKSMVFVCIGTDRSTGDSLGPLVGYKVKNIKYDNVFIHGNLEQPVHAKNIEGVMTEIYQKYEAPFVVAIDACLGKLDHIGFVTIGEGAIKPGAGVNKNLSPVGNIHITGIVNFSGMMDFLVLQNTRLSVVMKMADLISMGIRYVLWKIDSEGGLFNGRDKMQLV